MASPSFPSAVMPVWQGPFVEVIKYGMTHRNVGWHTQGDVEQTQDQHIHKNIFRIRGAIAATNYLRVPRDAAKGTHGLGLTGRYAYLQVRRMGDQPMTIHLDFVTNKKTALRFTLSSIYQLLRSTGTVLRIPLSLDARWTVVVVDMVRLLEFHSFNQYARNTYRHLKTITLCASMNVRNVFVSPTLYTPMTLPSTLRFPGGFGDEYRWLMLPTEDNSSFGCNIHQHLGPLKQEDLRFAVTPEPVDHVCRNSIKSPHHAHYEAQSEKISPTREVEVGVFTKMSPRTRDSNLRCDRHDILSKADQILRDAGIFDAITDTTSNQESMDSAYQSPLSSPAMKFAAGMKQGLRTRIVSSSTKAEWPDPILELDRVIGFSNDFPRMLIWVPGRSAFIYSSSSTIIFREFCDENTASNQPNKARGVNANNPSTEAVKGSIETVGSTVATREHFLYGHSAVICALAVTSDGSLLASAELPTNSNQSGVRLWDLSRRECITVVKAQPKGVHGLCFSPPTKRQLLLCVVGRDECFRTQIFVWDCSCLQGGTEGSLSTVSLMARQTSNFPIDRIAFSPYEGHDHYHLVSCGRENIRYWRVNSNTGHLTGCPVILNEYSRRTVFTDVAFDAISESHPSNIERVRPLYVTSSLGTLLVINYYSKQVICVYQLHDTSINCLSVNEGFCVTGSDDCFLRVWPLDFTDFFLEAHHEAGVNCLDVSADGMRVLVGSRNNSIGVLDVSDQQYATLLRSHTKEVTAITTAPWGSPLATLLLEDDAQLGGVGTAENELVTASNDGTMRVWDTSSGHQLYEFDMQQERVTSLAACPGNSGIVAAGFATGCTRIFDVHRTSKGDEITDDSNNNSCMLHEFRQHQSSILHIAFDVDGQHLFTSGAGKQLCLYDARQQDYLPLKMLLTDFDPDDGRFEVSHDNKWLTLVSCDHYDIVMLDPCSLRVVAMVRPPKEGQEETLKLARFSNHSTELLVLSDSDRLHIFSLPGREYVQSMPLLGQGGISALVMSANAKYMATGGVDGSLRVWNWDDRGRIGRMHQSFLGHAGKVGELAFTKDGKSIVASGESSAICIWQFHGDSCPTSPRTKSNFIHASGINQNGQYRINDETSSERDGNEDCGQYCNNDSTVQGMSLDRDKNDENPALSARMTATSSKANFILSLEDDALKLGSGTDDMQRVEIDSVLSANTNLSDADIPTVAVGTTSDTHSEFVLSSAIGGFDTSTFAWSYSTGKLVYTTKATLGVEEIASGQQTFYDDYNSYDMDHDGVNSPLNEIVLVQLSTSGQYVAMVSSRFDVVVVRALTSGGQDKGSTEKNANSANNNQLVLIALPPDTSAIVSLAFAQRSHRSQNEELICMACEIGLQNQQQYAIVIACTIQRCIIWSSLNSGVETTNVRQILATSDSEFLLLSGECIGISTLTIYYDGNITSSGEAPRVELEPLIGAFPTDVQLISLYNQRGNIDQLRYLVGIDNDRYCYFYDLRRKTFAATTQLLLLSKSGGNQAGNKVKNTNKVVEFMEWVTTAGKSLLITGSKTENVLYVHGLPMLSTKHSARVQVDWLRMARAGVSLMCKIALSGGGSLRSLSVDPVREVGIATTDDGTIAMVHFDQSPTTKTLRETAAVGSEANLPLEATHVSTALEGAVILSTSHNSSAIRVWLPELSKEVATFQVDSAICSCLAVNPFSTTPAGTRQSMVMAAYSDGSLRVLDLREMRLLSRFELVPSSAKSARYSFDRIVFVGAFTALVVTKDNCVLLVDISNALEQPEDTQRSRGTNLRSMSSARRTSRICKKIANERTRSTKAMARGTGNRKTDREVTYRELALLPWSYSQRKRLPSLAKSEQVHVEVEAVEVMNSSDGSIHPFLIVVKYTGPARYREGRCVAKVFADPTMSVLRGEEITPTDEWRLNNYPNLDQCVAAFTTSKSPYVLYPCKLQQPEPNGPSRWGLELRDCSQQRIIQRFAFNQLAPPVLLRCVKTPLSSSSPVTTTDAMLVVDSDGRMALFDIGHHLLIPITPPRLQLKPCSNVTTNTTSLLLTSPTQVATATLAILNN